jgi:hypothetical protein
MAPPTLGELKGAYRIEDSANDEALTRLLVVATAQVESYLGRVIWDTVPPSRVFGALRASYAKVRGLRITDDAVNNRPEFSTFDDYGRATNLPSPTSVTAELPLSTLPDFAARIDPVCGQAIIDLAADIFYRPNPQVQVESENGVMTNYGRLVHGMPARVVRMLKPIKHLSAL